MKKHLSKRLLSLFLAVLMVVTAAPLAAFGASDLNGDEIRYLFAYFTGNNGEEQVRFAVSEDGLSFEALNGNSPVLNNNAQGVYPAGADGMGIAPSGCARDPYILPKKDGSGYYIIATDLEINNTNYRNSKLLVWDIDDISKADEVTPWNIETSCWFSNYNYGSSWTNSSTGMSYADFYAWAPEAIYVADKDQYMLYWSAPRNQIDGNDNYGTFGIYAVYTQDFQTFYNAAGQLLSADGSASPDLIYNPSNYQAIDADITYKDGTYYMWHKNEDSKTLDLAVSTSSSNGPYSWVKTFYESDYEIMEGPFVYELADGRYVLMMDWYGDGYENARFLSYISSDLQNFEHNSILNTVNINYLKPRHGNICQISADEYEALAKNYGKVTYYGQNWFGEGSVNDDTLMARYFTNDDLSADATGHGYTLTTGGLSVGVDGNATYAHFAANGGTAQSPGSGGYAERNIADMMDDYGVNAKDGVTVSFYARSSDSASNRRFFELTTYNRGEWGSSNPQGSYVNLCTNDRLEIQSANFNDNYVTGSGSQQAPNQWSLYTVTITESFVALSVNGVLRSTYSPLYSSAFTSDIFDQIMNGNLLVGCSSYSTDTLFSGDIYDLRLYNRALSNDEVQESLDELGSSVYVGKPLDDVAQNRLYFDPMQTVENAGISYTGYDQTVFNDEQGYVLQTSGGAIKGHNSYNGVASESGYTLSFWYNPGDSIDGAVFTIGNHNASDGVEEANKKYFTVTETGGLWYCYNNGDGANQSYADITGIFGSEGLKTNEWQHIIMQIVPNGSYEKIYTYINGSLVSEIDVYQTASNSILPDRSVTEFFALQLPVYYGVPYKNYSGTADWHNGSGLLDSVSVYSDVFSASDVYLQCSVAQATTLLRVAISDYLEKMSKINGQLAVYTNMSDAYTAYNRAQRYIDAVEKGDVPRDAQHYAELYTDLVIATNNMQLYTKPADIGGMGIEDSGVSTAIDSQYTNNMLSTVNISRPMEWQGGSMSDAGQNMSIATGTFVWMYTGISGDTPTAPINAGVYIREDKTLTNYYAHYLYTTSDMISLAGNWQMSNRADTIDWYWPSSGNGQMGIDPNSGYDSWFRVDDYNTQYWYYGSNVMSFDGDSSSFTGSGNYTDYFIELAPEFSGCLHTSWSFGNNQHNTSDFWPQGSIYVINFARVNQALLNGDRLNAVANVSKYTPDSISALLSAYDALTSQEYLFSNASEEGVTEFAKLLDSEVKTLEGVDLQALEPFANADELETVRDSESQFHDSVIIEDNGDATIPAGEEDAGETYTASSWTAYDKAYQAVKEYFASLNPFGADNQYATSQTQLDTLTQNINSAKAHLVARADYSPVDNAIESEAPDYTQTYGLGNGTGADDQKYTYGTWNSFSEAYDNANDWYVKDAQYRADTEKYDIDWVTNENISRNPYIAIDAQGNVVTSDSQTPDWYMYVGDFYDDPNDTDPSQFETGDYVKLDGETIKLNGHRYAPGTIDWNNYSDRQTQINYDGPQVGTTYDQLAAPADYSAYDAAAELLKYQDIAAFTDDYISSESSVYGIIGKQGTKDEVVNYSNGAATADGGITINTPAYDGSATAYVTDEGTVWKNQNDQTALDGVTTGLLTDLEEVNTTDSENRSKFNVSYSYRVGEDGADNQVYNGAYYYGETYTANAPEGLNVYKWVVTANGTTMEIPASQTYDALITSDVTIVAYCSQEAAENEITVQIQNQYGHLVQEYKVAADTQITVDKNVYILGEQRFDVADTPFYVFDGWQVNGHNYNNGTTFTASEAAENDVVILTMKFNVASGYYDVTMDGGSVHDVFNDVDGTAFKYDTEVTATPAEGSYGIALKIGNSYYAVSYNDADGTVVPYTFYTVGDVQLYSIYFNDGEFVINNETVTDPQTVRKLDMRLPFSYTIAQSQGGVFTSYSATTANLDAVPDGAAVTEVGTIYTTDPAVAADPNAFVLGGENVSCVAAKNQLDTMQYFLRFNTGGKTVYTRSYVKYSFGEEVSATGHDYTGGTVIQTVDYGNIVSGS